MEKTNQTAKNTKKWSFFISLSIPPYQSRSLNKKTTEHATSCNSLITSCNCNLMHSITCLKTCRRGPKWLKALKFVYPSLLNLITKQNKTAWGTLIISSSYNISHYLTCPKTWRKLPKWLKIPKIINFHNFEHSSLPISNKIKQKKWAHNYMRLFYHLMQF